MIRMMKVLALLAVVLPAALGCNAREPEPRPSVPSAGADDLLTLRGVIRHSPLEGGIWYIEANGTRYSPMNLPDSLQRDSTAIEADVRVRNDMMGIGQVGPIVEIVQVRTVGP